ncbi:hypothetical protein GBA52_014187 [Prunus armeniaca]|nr:hypothetical protein GBA52_014187 [Prunus armeniaca]
MARGKKIVDYNFKNKQAPLKKLSPTLRRWVGYYQRLEVLGDSALNHAVTNYFFCISDRKKVHPGHLTKLRCANTENLNLRRSSPFVMTELNEFCQKNRKLYEIKLRPRHETRDVSIADVYVDGEFFASGWSNKKEGAKRNAAIEAVNKLFQSVVVDDGSFQGSAVGNNMSFRIEEAIQGCMCFVSRRGCLNLQNTRSSCLKNAPVDIFTNPKERVRKRKERRGSDAYLPPPPPWSFSLRLTEEKERLGFSKLNLKLVSSSTCK